MILQVATHRRALHFQLDPQTLRVLAAADPRTLKESRGLQGTSAHDDAMPAASHRLAVRAARARAADQDSARPAAFQNDLRHVGLQDDSDSLSSLSSHSQLLGTKGAVVGRRPKRHAGPAASNPLGGANRGAVPGHPATTPTGPLPPICTSLEPRFPRPQIRSLKASNRRSIGHFRGLRDLLKLQASLTLRTAMDQA